MRFFRNAAHLVPILGALLCLLPAYAQLGTATLNGTVTDPNAISARTPNQWFNTAAFTVPPPFTRGNAGRNILRTDSLTNLDFALYKRWKVRETRHVELRGEAFNLLNQPSFGYPGTIVGTPQFGRVSNTRNGGRQIQLALKIHF